MKFLGNPNHTEYRQMKYNKNQNDGVKNIPKSLPPSIPSKKVSAAAYSGKRSDTVGPALYNPNLN